MVGDRLGRRCDETMRRSNCGQYRSEPDKQPAVAGPPGLAHVLQSNRVIGVAGPTSSLYRRGRGHAIEAAAEREIELDAVEASRQSGDPQQPA